MRSLKCFFFPGLYNNLQECSFELRETGCPVDVQAGVECYGEFNVYELLEIPSSEKGAGLVFLGEIDDIRALKDRKKIGKR